MMAALAQGSPDMKKPRQILTVQAFFVRATEQANASKGSEFTTLENF
jgi:hypothetical protein